MTHQSIVLELQSLATDRKNNISDLLRKALVVATKLKLDDFKAWVNRELHGYRDASDVPEYRKARSELKLKNPYHGLIPIVIGDQRIADIICNVEIRDPIEGLENLLDGADKDGFLTVPLSHAQQAFLMKMQDGYSQLPAVRLIGRNQIATVVDAVRTTILEWALQLETEGILGSGMSFTAEERNKAVSNPSINIHNFQGVLGNVNDSTVTQNLNMTIVPGNFESMENFLKAQGVTKPDIELLRSAIEQDPTPESGGTFGKKVSAWIGKMLTKASDGSWSIGIGAAGNLLAAAVSKYYGM